LVLYIDSLTFILILGLNKDIKKLLKQIREDNEYDQHYIKLAAYLEEYGRYLEAINILKLGFYKSSYKKTLCNKISSTFNLYSNIPESYWLDNEETPFLSCLAVKILNYHSNFIGWILNKQRYEEIHQFSS
jgi:hypothetical protein